MMNFLPNPLQASDPAQGWNMMAFLKISYYLNSLSLCPKTKPGFLLWNSGVILPRFQTESPQRAPTCPWHKLPVMFFSAKPRGVCPGNGSSPHTTTCAQQQAPLLAAGRDMEAHGRKVPGHPCPCCPLCFPLTLCYSSCRLPLWFPGSIKLSSFLLLSWWS